MGYLSSMAQLATLEAFDCDGESSSVGSRWEKWKRAFEIYLLAANIDTDVKKRATLLHTGGLALQEIYYNIPGAHTEVKEGTDVYHIAIKNLDNYFSPKQSFLYERHIFRLTKQEPDEKFDKFIVRLRHQSTKCNFSNIDDNLIDQITEKCISADLRKKILLLGDSATVDKIINEANALETVERQLNDFEGKQSNSNTNKIREFQKNARDNLAKTKIITKECSRCGSKAHSSDCATCPARDKDCAKCGFLGHFQNQCRTRSFKRKTTSVQLGSAKNYKKHTAEKPTSDSYFESESNIDYIFHIDDNDA